MIELWGCALILILPREFLCIEERPEETLQDQVQLLKEEAISCLLHETFA